MATTLLGPIVSQWQLETGVLNTIDTWLETYISAVERSVWGETTAAILPRPGAAALLPVTNEGTHSVQATSIYGGIDLLSGSTLTMPNIVVLIVPEGDPEYFALGNYTVQYELQIACQCYGEDETLARMYAELYGSAVTALILQNGSLGGVASRTRLTAAPRPEYVDPDNPDDNLLIQTLSTFAVYVDSSYNDFDAIAEPVTGDPIGDPDPSQLPADWPDATTVNMVIQALAASDTTSAATFTGSDVINFSE